MTLALLSACDASSGSDHGRPPGKADDFGTCGEDRNCLRFASYDVLFTNPVCKTYEYEQPMKTIGGKTVTAKPQNVYCTQSDSAASAARESSPQFRLLSWLSSVGDGDEVFAAYLSFSSSAVSRELCAAVERGAKVTLVLDQPTAKSDELEACGGTVLIRGHEGGIGFAHNKITIINPKKAGPADEDPAFMKLVFSSGNLSSGVVLHHENWHFIDVARDSFFAQAHLCLMKAQISETASASKKAYKKFMNECRAKIEAEPEDDIKAFFVPNTDDSDALFELLDEGISTAATADIGAHRFALTQMVNGLADRLQADDDFQARLVVDDDLYWLRPANGEDGEQVGDNLPFERDNIDRLEKVGDGRFEVKYMQTNHGPHLLHHNKFLIFHDMPKRSDSVLCGAANLTGTGFRDNFENVYWVEIPQVVKAFDQQFARFWDGKKASPDEDTPPQASSVDEMPVRNVLID